MNPTTETKKAGPIIAILIIVLVLIIAALYLFASRVSEEPIPGDSNSAASVTPLTNTSDDVDAIQKDLDSATNGIDGQNI